MLSAEAHIHIMKQEGLTKRQMYLSGRRYIMHSRKWQKSGKIQMWNYTFQYIRYFYSLCSYNINVSVPAWWMILSPSDCWTFSKHFFLHSSNFSRFDHICTCFELSVTFSFTITCLSWRFIQLQTKKLRITYVRLTKNKKVFMLWFFS